MAHRTFIAVDLDEASRVRLDECRADLLPHVPRSALLKWVAAQQLHLTVKFLGDVDDDQLLNVCRAAEAAAASIEPFVMTLQAPQSLPQRMTDRMLLVEIIEPAGRLAVLAERVERAMVELGFPPEGRAFRPHVTLARSKSRRGRLPRSLTDALAACDLGQSHANHLSVYTSELTPDGPVYTPAATCMFGRG